MKLKISSDLSLPLDSVTQTFVVYGSKGMGKTVFGAVLAEELSRCKQKFSYLDPIGPGYGLRYSSDGKGPGLDILVLGGKHGDLPIEPSGGAVVADLVVDENVNTVVDISRRADGKMWSKGEKIRFTADYCTRLYERQGEKCFPMMQIIDEAGRFVPQMIPANAPETARCVGAIEELVELGRNVGVGVCLITQRSARMNKSVSELAECMVAFRTIGPNSVNAITDWLGDHIPKERHKTMVEQLRALPKGEALVVSPGWLQVEAMVKMRMRNTFDSSATPTADKKIFVLGSAAKPDLEKYRQLIASTIERARENDPGALKRQITELKQKLTKSEQDAAKVKPAAPGKTKVVTETKIEQVEIPALSPSQEGLLLSITRICGELSLKLDDAKHLLKTAVSIREDIITKLAAIRKSASKIRPTAVASKIIPAAVAPVTVKIPQPAAPVASPVDPDAEFKPSKCQKALLTVLAQFSEGCAVGKLALLARYSQGGTLRTELAGLRTSGAIVGANVGIMRITEFGLSFGPFDPLPAGDDLIEFWKSHPAFGKAHREFIEALRGVPDGYTQEELCAASESKYAPGGTVRTILSNLRTAGVIVGKNTERMRLNPDMFG